MFLAICTLVSLATVGLVALIHAALYAPYGVEDHNGFHQTSPQEDPEQILSTKTLAAFAGSTFFQY